jgi:hypothetical protein
VLLEREFSLSLHNAQKENVMRGTNTSLFLKANKLIGKIRKQTEEGLRIIEEAKKHIQERAWPRPFASNDP